MTLTRLGAVVALLAVVAGGVAVLRRPPASPILATITLGQPPWLMSGVALDTHAGRAIVGDDAGQRIDVVDTHSGALVRSILFAAASNGNGLRPLMMHEDGVVDEQNGHAFVPLSTRPPGLAILDTRSGRLIRVLPFSAMPGSNVGLDVPTHHLFDLSGGYSPEQVNMRDATSGRLLHTTALDPPASPSSGYGWGSGTMPILVDTPDERVFVSHFDSNVVSVLDTRHGRLLRTVTVAPTFPNTGISVATPVLDARTHRVFVSAGTSGTVVMLDARSGRLLRAINVSGFTATPVVDEATNRVVILTTNDLDMLDARSGRMLARSSLPGGLGGIPIIDPRGGLIIAPNQVQNTVEMFNGSSGRLLRATPIGGTPGSGMTVAVDARGGYVFAVRTGPYDWHANAFTGSASLVVLDLRSGRIRRTLALDGVGDGRAYVDDRAGRALVLVSGGPAVAEPDPYGWLPSWLRRRLPFLPRPHARTRMAPATLTVLDLARLL